MNFVVSKSIRSSGVAKREQLGARAPRRRPWGCINTLYSAI